VATVDARSDHLGDTPKRARPASRAVALDAEVTSKVNGTASRDSGWLPVGSVLLQQPQVQLGAAAFPISGALRSVVGEVGEEVRSIDEPDMREGLREVTGLFPGVGSAKRPRSLARALS
jgi:hypothetical protein